MSAIRCIFSINYFRLLHRLSQSARVENWQYYSHWNHGQEVLFFIQKGTQMLVLYKCVDLLQAKEEAADDCRMAVRGREAQM